MYSNFQSVIEKASAKIDEQILDILEGDFFSFYSFFEKFMLCIIPQQLGCCGTTGNCRERIAQVL